MITPYYQDGLVTIYQGDCREVVKSLGDIEVGLVLTDPPYGIDLPTDYASRGRGKWSKDYAPVYDDDKPFDPTPWLEYPRAILWGANYFADKLPITNGWLVWDKRLRNENSFDQADGELAWTNCIKGVRIFRHMWGGFYRDSERRTAYHPTQKPVALMRWVLGKVGAFPGAVLDPYMGSGPVAVACKELGIPYIGIEIMEEYCETAATRCQNTLTSPKGGLLGLLGDD